MGALDLSSFINHPMIRSKTIQSRIYQQILYGMAIKDDTLIVLPTGLGKTVVFIMVIAHYLNKFPDSSVVITAPTRPLVTQHYDSCIQMLNIDLEDVQVISGETSPEERSTLWQRGKVFIATPQTLRNDIIANRIDLKKVSLICFDEAHRAVGDDPYVLCAEQYNLRNPKGRILGFTASPGSSDKITTILENLHLSQFEYMDEDHPQVKPYVHNTTENWVWVDLPPEFQQILSLLNEIVKEHLINLKEIGAVSSIVISRVPKRVILQIPSYLNSNRENLDDDSFFTGMSSYGQLMLLYQGIEMLETQGITTLHKYLQDKQIELEKSKKKSLLRLLSTPTMKQILKLTENLILNSTYHPKLEKLQSLVHEQINQSTDSRILIFANYKATTSFLVDQLGSIDGVSAHRFVGQSSSNYGKGLSQKEQKQIMDQFRNGEYNVLVSTSVGEEGLDVAQCDLVIFYDVTPSSTRYIQRSGRTGRAREGRVVILITKGTRDEGYFYASQRQKSQLKQAAKEIKIQLSEEKEAKQQTDLHSFFDETDDTQIKVAEVKEQKFDGSRPVIYVDHRERGTGLIRKLLKENIELKQTTLPVGDFILSSRVAVERKTTRDFSQTLIRGDLFDQLIQLKATYLSPILLIEGSDLFSSSINSAAIIGTLNSILVDYGIPIIQTVDEDDTLLRLVSIAKREQERKDRTPQIRGGRQEDTLLEQQLSFLASLPNINNILAERILTQFKTPMEFLNAPVEEMRKVHGIGPQIAHSIKELVDSDTRSS
ncbi:MAG: DEAD/DEAH box helicase [Candidatus Kariarchaeaceae archaeon]